MIRSRSTSLLTAAVMVGVIAGLVPAATAVAKPTPTWRASRSPSPRYGMAMAYDPADGQIVLFGGLRTVDHEPHYLGDTWTWDGSAWTKQHPAHSPSRRGGAGISYDPADGGLVLFGGTGGGNDLDDTWVWNGTDWTQQHPAHSPPAHFGVSMAYAAVEGRVVLFGGSNFSDETWTWDGSDWSMQSPDHAPCQRRESGIAYDALRAQVVLFSGIIFCGGNDADTWTWQGSDWTLRSPAHAPPPRFAPGMAFDDITGETVLLGGERTDTENIVADMWSWEGTDWTQQHPAHLTPRRWAAGMAYDGATGQIVLFGGQGGTGQDLGDLWTWDGTDWTGHLAGMIKVIPRSGPPGSAVDVEGWGFARREHVKFWFVDDVNGRTLIGTTKTDRSGGFRRTLIIPGNATPGTQHVKAIGRTSGQIGRAGFDVT
jgi:hypothetical protein